MPRHKVEDAPGGDTVIFDVVDDNGYRQCTFGHTYEAHQELFNKIPDIKCNDDDFLLNSYPKTGTNWLWEMLMMVMIKSGQVTGGSKGHGMIEAMPIEVTENLPSPRILNTHLKIKYLPKEALGKKLKMILLLRNPKDVVVSFYNHTKGLRFYEYDGKFENYLHMFMKGEVDYGSYPDYLQEWQTFMKESPDYPILVVYYEDLKQDCAGEMKKICKFLEKDVSDDLLKEIVESCQIDKMRKGKQEKMTEEMKKRMQTLVKNKFSLLRKGQIGDWKNWFTVAQNEAFEKWWEEETKDINAFSFKYC
ncbi:sulfotransferase 1B1-like [Mercenaria mercenaria]|uniref:sulfotransferase 1B1-like n=1 Tax=Mercenaria mercenaria TaxID=6596 RepID=UPI001E1DFAC6|nr:sulfotransferase 1B1-like [Mercenaria mercenaria]XP_045173117.1 sulfotransferase 1B1-like [Mercenaria mercenaria]XP_045173118.1 sulfotransferase 1B1-like [Mercenaria mercenaria]XP_053375868.1 sulfotransferase 1B1-like [Mercenaria mercenaria]